jgi:cytoskeletal protein RodZ
MENNTFKINDNTSSFQNNSPSFFQWVKSISIYTWILLFIVLSLLGFNIVVYLEKIKQYLKDGGEYIYNIIKRPQELSKEPEKTEVSHSHKEEPASEGKEKKISEEEEEAAQRNAMKNNALNIALNESSEQSTTTKMNDADYQADDSRSFLNSRKDGWCFIGENNGARVCGEVGLNDDCMSGNIFPSREICVNPNVRV